MANFSRRRGAAHARGRRHIPVRRPTLHAESLEARALLSAVSVIDSVLAQPFVDSLASPSSSSLLGLTPSQVRAAYGFDQITFNGGTIQGDGSGQTIAIVAAFNHPNIVNDLHLFSQTFGLTDPPSFSIMNQSGGSNLPAADATWAQEIALDVEWAHAIAPGAGIVLVEANTAAISDLMIAVNTARKISGVSVVSMSWGSSEFSGELQYDKSLTTPAGHTPITYVTSAGDHGAQALWPAVSPNVLSVGGTSLSLAGAGYGNESAWSSSGGGTSVYESQPVFQSGVQTAGMRTAPDVSYNANPNSGVAVYDSYSQGGSGGWFRLGGTSAGAPQWAGLLAIANQGRVLSGQNTLGNVQDAMYDLPSSDFHDVTSGSNGNPAKAGYDLVTGRGSPIANLVVRDLVGSAPTTTPAPATPIPPTPAAPASTPQSPTLPTERSYPDEVAYWRLRYSLEEVASSASQHAPPVVRAAQDMGQIATALAQGATSGETYLPPASTLLSSGTTQPTTLSPAASVVVVMMGASHDATAYDAPAQTLAEATFDDTRAAPSVERPTDAAKLHPAENLLPAQPSTGAENGMSWSAEPTLAAAIEACFAADGWALPVEDFVAGLPEQLARSWDVDLALAVAGLAIANNFARQDDPSLHNPARKSRWQMCALDCK